MNCLIINIQESVWREMQRGFNTATRDAVETLIGKGFSLYVFDRNLKAIHENIDSTELFRECLKKPKRRLKDLQQELKEMRSQKRQKKAT